MPPTIVKAFEADNNFSGEKRVKGLGSGIGSVQLDDGSLVEGREGADARPVELSYVCDTRGEARTPGYQDSHQEPLVWILRREQQARSFYRNQDSALCWREHESVCGRQSSRCFSQKVGTVSYWVMDVQRRVRTLRDSASNSTPTRDGLFVLSCEGLAKGVDGMQREPSAGVWRHIHTRSVISLAPTLLVEGAQR